MKEFEQKFYLDYGRIVLEFKNLLNSEKGRLWSLRQSEATRMRIMKTAELEGYFHWLRTVMMTFLLFDIRTTIGPLEVSVRSLQNLPAFEAEGSEAFEICRFPKRCPKEYVFDVCKVCGNQKRKKKVPKEYTLYIHLQSVLNNEIPLLMTLNIYCICNFHV